MSGIALPDPPNVDDVRAAAMGDPAAIPALVRRLVDEHGDWNAGCLSLVASHNFLSPSAKALLSSSVADFILSGTMGKRSHAGGAWIEAIDGLVVDLCKRVFGAVAVEYRAMSGAQAIGLVLSALTRPGDTIIALPARHGGHHTYREDGYGGVLGLRILDIPYDESAGEIDLDQLETLARRERPKLIAIGTATLLFPYPVARLRAIADMAGAKLLYDGAHILGLVAGGQFQDPLKEGAHILTGSTQKTLGGPIGGLILSTDAEAGAKIIRKTSNLVSNYHNNRIAALAVTLAETVSFGRAFAASIVSNARALARSLDREGVPVMARDRGYTSSHVVLMDMSDHARGPQAFQLLENARILTSRTPLPHTYPERRGIRLGTAAVARLGMDENAMARIATLIRRVVTGEPPTEVAADVTELARSYPTVRHCF